MWHVSDEFIYVDCFFLKRLLSEKNTDNKKCGMVSMFFCIYMSCRWSSSWLIDKFFHKNDFLQIKEQVLEKKFRQVKGTFMSGICKNAYGGQAIKN